MLGKRGVLLIAITGTAGSGKDTLAEGFVGFGYRRLGFADSLKKMLQVLPHLEEPHWKDRNWKEAVHSFYGKSPRKMAQTLGTEWMRAMIHPDAWVKIMEDFIQRKIDMQKGRRFVIADLRYENEAGWVRRNGGIILHVKRIGGSAPVETHSSEDGIVFVNQIDRMVYNDATPELLRGQAKAIHEFMVERIKQLST